MQTYSGHLAFFSLFISCCVFKKYYGFFWEASKKTIGANGGVKTVTGAKISCYLFGILMPAAYFYIVTMHTLPLATTLLVGKIGTQEYIFKERIHRIRQCSKPLLRLEGVDGFSSRVCELRNQSTVALKKGDNIKVSGLKSSFGIIPKSYEVLN